MIQHFNSLPLCLLLLFLLSACHKEICSEAHEDFIIEGTLGNTIDNGILVEKEVKFSGSVLLLDEGMEMIHKSYQYGKRNSPCEVIPEAAYWIGSVSKQFCAVAILQLQEDGLLAVSDPISQFFSALPNDKKDITIHQLLTHTSGLADLYPADGIADREKALLALLKDDLVQTPGTEYAYSNQGYQLLAIIVEVVSGSAYEQFLQETFFQPLGLQQTASAGDQGKWNQLTVSAKSRRARSRSKGNPQDWETNYGYKGSTGILTTAKDLQTWYSALYQNTILSPASTTQLFSKQVQKGEGLYYGYGWNILDSENGLVIVHSGDDDFIGHSATLRYYREQDRLIIVLSNSGYHEGKSVARAVASLIIGLVF